MLFLPTVGIAAVIIFSLSVRWLGPGRSRSEDRLPIQIEVLNGTGEQGAAMRVAMELRKSGIDVLIVGNAERFDFAESLIIDRRGNPQLVERLARLLGGPRVLVQIKEKSLVDATLIIGADVERLSVEAGH